LQNSIYKYLNFILLVVFIFPVKTANSTEEFAKRTQQTCSMCHQSPNGGPLNPVGISFIRNDYQYPIPERILDKSHRLSQPFHRIIQQLLGYLHLIAACVLVGTIFYVDVLIKPRSLTTGLPKGERVLGLSCFVVLIISGVYLTWYRLDSFNGFFQSHFGILLFIKLVLFIILVSLALISVTRIHQKMRRGVLSRSPSMKDADLTSSSLSSFDGQEGRPAYVAYKDNIYDLSNSPKWKGGTHFRKHMAGRDLTDAIKNAPHGSDVFNGFPVVKEFKISNMKKPPEGVHRIYVFLAHTNLFLVFLILLCVSSWKLGFPIKTKPFYRQVYGNDISNCLQCHQKEIPGIYSDWKRSIHAKMGVSCSDCHQQVDSTLAWVNKDHYQNTTIPISVLVTPKTCAKCHDKQKQEYAQSKHAHTLQIINKIDKWLIHGMNNQIEQTTGCNSCHGTRVEFTDGKPQVGTWPNVGVGRQNPDSSLGSCTSCHTRHCFSIVEARKPEACDQCHLGPDHPQIEIYNESKHGTIYHAEGNSWNWTPDDHHWIAGRDYRSPTCASCHMSEGIHVSKTHDVTERLSWELQAPLTIRPAEFEPFPAKTDWVKERRKMKSVCMQCHSKEWTLGHFNNLDSTIYNYNNIYFVPISELMNELYLTGVVSESSYFDDEIEWEFYEFWHHEGRRARMGAAMMAPDYAWWHGFYELKYRYNRIVTMAGEIKKNNGSKNYQAFFPGKYQQNQQ